MKRFRVVFQAIDGREFRYYVCTLQDERKATVLAAQAHSRAHPSEWIFRVSDLALVDGDQPYGNDIVDRAEW